MAENQANPANQVQPQQGNPAAKGVTNKLQQVAGKEAIKPDELKKIAAKELGIFKPDIFYLT